MFTLPGFLGTKALFFMDIVTIYFALLPFLLALSIRFAIKKQYTLHFKSQFFLLAFTLLIVVIFEIGVRISGGFLEYAQHSALNYNFLLIFLIIHIIIALAAVAGWIYLIISSYKDFKNHVEGTPFMPKHKLIARSIFAALTLTSLMGVLIYLFLFIF